MKFLHNSIVLALPILLFACQTEPASSDNTQSKVEFEHDFYQDFLDTPSIETDTIEMIPNGLVDFDESDYTHHSALAIRADYSGNLVRANLSLTRELYTANREGFIGPSFKLYARTYEDEYRTHLGGIANLQNVSNSTQLLESSQIAFSGGLDEIWVDIEVQGSQLKIDDADASLTLDKATIEQATLSDQQKSDQVWALDYETGDSDFCDLDNQKLSSSLFSIALADDIVTLNGSIEYDSLTIGSYEFSGRVDSDRLEGTLTLNHEDLTGTYDGYVYQNYLETVYGYAQLASCNFEFDFDRQWGWELDELTWETIYNLEIGAGTNFEDLDIIIAHGSN